MKTEEQRLQLGELNQQERKNLREGAYWESCLTAFLDSARPSSIREWIKGPRETFLRYLDGKAWDLAKAVEMHGAEEAETLAQLFPMWEDSLLELPGDKEDEERDKEEAQALTPQERKSLLAELLPE